MKITILYKENEEDLSEKEFICLHEKWDISEITNDIAMLYRWYPKSLILNIAITRV